MKENTKPSHQISFSEERFLPQVCFPISINIFYPFCHLGNHSAFSPWWKVNSQTPRSVVFHLQNSQGIWFIVHSPLQQFVVSLDSHSLIKSKGKILKGWVGGFLWMELLSSRSPNFQKWLECHSFIGKNLYSFFAADKLAKKFKNSPPPCTQF